MWEQKEGERSFIEEGGLHIEDDSFDSHDSGEKRLKGRIRRK